MVMVHRAAALLRGLFGRQRLEADLDAEIAAYLDMLVDRGLARGLSADEAWREARIELDSRDQVKENVRDVRAGATLESIFKDVAYAARTVKRNPGFAAVAILTLALGIGVNAAIFSVVYAVLLRPLPYDHPEQLGLIWSTYQKSAGPRAPTSGPIEGEVERRTSSLTGLGAIWVGNGTFTGDANPEQVKVGFVTPNFLQVLGVAPALGRHFDSTEHFRGRPAIILSHGLWERRFGGDPGVVGRGVPFQGFNVTVVGVLPADFQLQFATDSGVSPDIDVFMPFPYDLAGQPRNVYFLRMLARLKPGVPFGQAQKELDSVASQIRAAYTEYQAEGLRFDLVPLAADSVRDIRPALIALFAGSGFVLLICCLNVANLLLARSSDRRRELAMRSALGASQSRIVRQLMTEGLLLCTIAGAAGVALGWAGLHWLLRLLPPHLVRIENVNLNWPVLGFVAAVSLASVLFFGLAPGLESRKWDLIATLRQAGRGSGASARSGVRAALIVCEIGLGLMLVTGAGLMIRTLEKIQHVQPGFESRSLLTFGVDLPGSHYRTDTARSTFVKTWEVKLQSIPGVEQVGAVSHLPLDDYSNWYSPFRPEGATKEQASTMLADYRCVTPDYFRAMGTRVLEGRALDEHDRVPAARKVVVVDDMLARAAWPGQSPIGKKIEAEFMTNGEFANASAEVVGLVEHVRDHRLAQQIRGQIYIVYEQSARAHLSYVVRSRVPPSSLAATVREALRDLDPDLAISKVRPMTVYLDQAKAPARFTALLSGLFAALAVLLAAIGIYGVVHYSVSRRMHEMGVRMALGAAKADVMRLVLREGLILTALGMALGVAGSLLVSRALESLIYGVSTVDPATYAAALIVVPLAALLGCWRPALKATRANPLDALRAE